MTTEQVERKIRETLHAVDLDRVRAPGDLVDKVVRRRARRRFAQVAGTVAAVAGITVGAVFGFGGGPGSDQDRPVRPAAQTPEGWHPWRTEARGLVDRGCMVDGSALYCAGYKYDAVKFDANTGERLWTVKAIGDGSGPVSVLSRPVGVRDGVLYVYRAHTAEKGPGGNYAPGTDLAAVNTDTGKVLWSVQLASDNRDDQAAVLIDGAVLANTPRDRTLSAVDPRTGKVKWRHSWGKGIWCDRVALSGVPYLLCSPETKKPGPTEFLRLDPATGRTTKVASLPDRQQIVGTWGDRIVLTTVPERTSVVFEEEEQKARTERLTVVDSSGRQTPLSYPVRGTQVAKALVGDRLISVTRAGRASSYSLTTGKVLWTAPVGIKVPEFESNWPDLAKPVVSAHRNVVYFFGPNGDLSGLDADTGERIWRGHIDVGKDGAMPQALVYGDVLIARSGSRMVSLLPSLDG
ncbi:putative membrane protein [Streptomyces scabiei 87.22]|uniref:Putative membrane protein n=1 Tax=Streptomyces scabiei (strain 87.22) TaxID=680198 RepID=C9Z8Q3_STRSW|nr:PQQ-binding-like beta-propeller repeat protein [Streptomyces scabiei]MDX2575102.1 PQQ-binding-like beta-propeller repeat protein [Streptomyces scabiei]MDX2651022.1 PQQ-binding-like beta-propeller repeat protein [Streptomyces scabiei]MDX2719636.1 PQQ-binding-like beta-propeller repeat protein [Streptomyces scabiei]MDX2869505.1 PQQ-binding-like beta-propeller repeat protein [Streptomyces scabiei]MDX2888292.1 PQQ-binding-like beta-propeller repeat protein [Streptomyces scabiei]